MMRGEGGSPSLSSQRGSGRSLVDSEQTFFKSRFGYDFSDVRLHTDSQAGTLAKSVQAKAFTVGRDVYFGQGEYQPGSSEGRRLIAHELTHTIQQLRVLSPHYVQRWSWGTGRRIEHPRGGQLIPVPPEHRERVESALSWVQGIRDRTDHPCHQFFRANCSRFLPNALNGVFRAAAVWFWEGAPPNRGGTSTRDIDAMAYTRLPYRLGILPLAANFFHEMLHLCGVRDEELADRAKRACGVPSLHLIGGELVLY